MGQKFANAARGELAAGITSAATSMTLVSPNGGLFPVADRGTGTTGDWFRIVIQDATNYEVLMVRTHAAGSDVFSNVLRAQEGSTARAWPAGAVVGLRPTAADASGWTLPEGGTTDDYLDGGRAWSSFFTKARTVTLAGLSTASNAVLAATDTILQAFGKLQGQINGHFNQGGGVHPNATTSESGFMSSADKTKLNGVATGAAALGSTAGSNLGTAAAGSAATAARSDHVHKMPSASDVGASPTGHTHPDATGSTSGLMSAANFTKLAGVAVGATANDTDANLLNRANHTGTQTLSTISDAGTAASKYVGTSWGNVMEVGAFGMGLGTRGTTIPDGSDLNDYRAFGFFSQITSADTQNMLNIPGKQAFGMFVMPTGGNAGVAQLWFQFNQGGQFWFRGYQSTTSWSPWRRVGATDLLRSASTTLDNTSFHHINAHITIPTIANGAPPVGSIIPCYLSANTQQTVSAASGVTLRHSGTTNTGTATVNGYGSFTLSHVNTNEWRISGDVV